MWTFTARKRQVSLMASAQLATRERRDMSSRVKGVGLSLVSNVRAALGHAQPGVNRPRL